jgi:hypothetical protein
MRGKGITFDTGFASAGTTTREPFDPRVVRRELQIILNDLHCNAVRITGSYPDRLKTAATYAAEAGLEVWLSPFTNGLTQDELLDLLADCADHAEGLRQGGAEVVMLTGSELSLFTLGFLPGDTLDDRLALIADPLRVRPMIGDVRTRINEFLRKAVAVVRAPFGGKVSYASLPLEGVDWSPFDIISTDAGYKTPVTAATFNEQIRAFVARGRAIGKPVAITEFGCTTACGAADGRGDLTMIEWGRDARPVRLKGDYVRDEDGQAAHLREVLDVFGAEGVDNAFVNTFARYDLPHHSNPRKDFDIASFGIVKVLDEKSGERGQRYVDMPWQPKAAFTTLASYYASSG